MEKEEVDESVVFVFYLLNNKKNDGEGWTYKNLPKGWWWVGAGGTESSIYPNEEQFNGPIEGREKMRELLEDKFSSLKEKGIIYHYKLENSYNP